MEIFDFEFDDVKFPEILQNNLFPSNICLMIF